MRTLVCLFALSLQAHGDLKHQSTGGRFQLVQLSEMRSDQYLLDTDTGKIWRMVCADESYDGGASCRKPAWALEFVEGISTPKRKD